MLDTQELIKTWNDPNSGLWDRGLAIGSVALDLVGIGAEVKGIVGAAKVGAKATEALGKILGVTTKAGETGKIGSEGGKVVTKIGSEAEKATRVEKAITEADKVGDTGRSVETSSRDVSSASCRPNSFSPDTPVATSNGEKPIGEVQVGEQVLAYNEASGTNGNYTVQAVLVNNDPAEVFLTIDGEKIETTPEHPWYTEDKGWVNAGELRIGEHIRKANGSSGEVQSLEFVRKPKVMYNLTVEQAHTFFVGEQQWLVHNVQPNCISQELINSTRERANAILDEGNTVYHLSNKYRGPVLTGIMDTQTHEIFYGINSFDKSLPTNLHPLLSQRLEEYFAKTGGETPLKAGKPGSHSEVFALDKALKAREARTGRRVSESELSDFLLHNRSLRGTRKGTGIPPRCPNCRALTDGVQVVPEGG
ncbi:MAG: hypothetical protein HXX20_08920 [Chloroflexi bacterium]|nr:hypothetical protein [Chloroflexota bacterium]